MFIVLSESCSSIFCIWVGKKTINLHLSSKFLKINLNHCLLYRNIPENYQKFPSLHTVAIFSSISLSVLPLLWRGSAESTQKIRSSSLGSSSSSINRKIWQKYDPECRRFLKGWRSVGEILIAKKCTHTKAQSYWR